MVNRSLLLSAFVCITLWLGFAFSSSLGKDDNTFAIVAQNASAQTVLNQTARLNSIALCIRGVNRKIENANNLREMFGAFDVDFFISGGSYHENYMNIMKPVAAVPPVDGVTLKKMLKQAGFNELMWSTVPHQNALGGINTPGSALFQYYDFFRCHNLIANHEKLRGQEYTSVIVVRSDHWCLAPQFAPSDLKRQAIYVPNGQNFDGLNDRMIALPRQFSEEVLCGPWNCLTKNGPFGYFHGNVENVWKQVVGEAQLPLIRRGATCFLACVKSTFAPRKCTLLNSTQAGYEGFKYEFEYTAALTNVMRLNGTKQNHTNST